MAQANTRRGQPRKVDASANPVVTQVVAAAHCSTSQAAMPLVIESNLIALVDTTNDPFLSQRSTVEDNLSLELYETIMKLVVL